MLLLFYGPALVCKFADMLNFTMHCLQLRLGHDIDLPEVSFRLGPYVLTYEDLFRLYTTRDTEGRDTALVATGTCTCICYLSVYVANWLLRLFSSDRMCLISSVHHGHGKLFSGVLKLFVGVFVSSSGKTLERVNTRNRTVWLTKQVKSGGVH